MAKYTKSHIKPVRLDRLPEALRLELKAARKRRGWTQGEVGGRIGLAQGYISGIESGKIVPRFDTLLDHVRALGLDLVLAPRALVPAITALIRDHSAPGAAGDTKGDIPLYAAGDDADDDDDDEGIRHGKD